MYDTFSDFTVLIIEDNTDNKNLYIRFLKTLEVSSILTAGTLEEASEIINANTVDCVITDMNLISTDDQLGLKVAEIFDPAKIILISGFLDKITLAKANEAGITNILSKPFSIDLLKRPLSAIYWSAPKRSQDILREISEYVCRWKPDGTFIYANEPYLKFFGVDFHTLINSNIYDEIPQAYIKEFKEHIDEITIENPTRYILIRHTHHDIDEYCRWLTKAVIENDKIVAYQSTGRDVNEVYEARQALAKSEKKYRKLFEDAADAIVLLDVNHIIIDCNCTTRSVFGYAKNELIGKDLKDFINDKDIGLFEGKFNDILKHTAAEYEIDIISHDKMAIPSWMKGQLMIDYDDKQTRVMFYIRELTALKTALTALESKTILQNIVFSTVPAFIIVKDAQLRFINANQPYLDFTGYSLEHIIGKTAYDLFPIEEANLFDATDKKVLEEGEVMQDTLMNLTSPCTGERITVSMFKTPIRENDRIIGLVNVAVDVTKRVFNEQLIHYTFDNMYDSIAVVDNRHEIIQTNRALQEQYGSDCIGRESYTLFSEDPDCKACPPIIDSSLSFEKQLFDLRVNRPCWKEINIYPFKDQDGKSLGSIVHIHDIDILKSNEHQLRYSLELQSLVSEISAFFIGLPINDIDRLIKISLRKVVEFLKVDRAYIYLKEDEQYLVLTHFWRDENTYIPSDICILDAGLLPTNGRDRLLADGCYEVEDISTVEDEQIAHLMTRANCHSVLLFPFLDTESGKNEGLLCVDMVNATRKWEANDKLFLALIVKIFSNALNRRAKDEKHHELYSLLTKLCDGMPDLFWAADSTGRLIFANKMVCEKLLNKDCIEIIGCHFSDFFSGDFVEKDKTYDLETITRGETIDFIGHVEALDVWLHVYKTAFYNDIGSIIGTVSTGRDVTADMNEKLDTDAKRQELEAIIRDQIGKLRKENETAMHSFNATMNQSLSKLKKFIEGAS